jgi:hypothetical protein
MVITITIDESKKPHQRLRHKFRRRYTDDVPISYNPNSKRLYTAVVHDNGKTIYLGTFDKLVYAWNARKSYWRTKLST